MILKNLARTAVLTAVALGPAALAGQAGNPAAQAHPNTAVQAPSAAAPAISGTVPAGQTDSGSGSAVPPAPHITIATEARATAPGPWALQDRIAWAANLILTLVADIGVIFFALLLRSISRQAHYAEVTAQAAADSAKAAISLVEAHQRAERPWILVAAEHTVGASDAFTIVATNRGRGPARIVALTEGIVFAKDESALPADPAYKESESLTPLASMVLLPGESGSVKAFRRDEVSAVCKTREQLMRVESWEERIYLYGKVAYVDLQSPDEKQTHDTAWCFWYIHGRQKSGMVMAGKPPYNQHS
jgi:hypothetical protein